MAGSLVLRYMDRRGHKRGLVRAKKHGTKSASGAPPDVTVKPKSDGWAGPPMTTLVTMSSPGTTMTGGGGRGRGARRAR